MSHPDDAALSEYAQGDLSGEGLRAIEGHLASCDACRGLVARLLQVLEPSRAHGPHKGLVVGRYVVLDAVGAGALGEVFSAHDSTLERTVALKWLYPSVGGVDRDTLRARLLAEARTLAKVQHPNVVAVHDVLAHEGADVIVMELVQRARSLRQLAETRGPWMTTVARFIAAARGLAAAHQAGVIHRDFKPDNVLLDGAGRVVVVDFGLARAADVVASPTSPASKRSALSGTPAYLAPERWQGRAADEASDQFSFCVALFECLAGRLPFAARELQERQAEVRAGPPSLASTGVSRRVEAALRRGLSFEPAARWPSMGALADELELALSAPRRQQHRLLGVGVLLAAVGLFTLTASRSRARCDDADAPARALWTTPRADAVRVALLGTRHPAAEALAPKVEAALTRYADALAEGRTRACRATAFEGDSDALLTLRHACTSRRASDFDALVRGLEAADGKTVERAVLAIESLPPAADCFEPASLTAVEPMPGGPARLAVEAVIPRVSAVRAMRQLGKVKDSVALAEAVTDEARRAGWRPLTSDVLLEWGAGLERLSRYDEAREKLVEGLTLAVAASDARQGFAAAVALAYLDGVDRQRPEAGATWVTVGHALGEPAKVRGTAEAVRLGNVEAVMAMRAGKAADAATLLTALEAQLTSAGGLRTINGARLLTNLSAAQRESGRAAEGVATAKRSLELMESLLSPNHPDVASAVNNLGSALADLGRLDEAEPYFRRSIALREALFGPEALALATPHYNLGELALRRGDGKTALEEYGRSRALVEQARGPDEDDVWDSKMGEGLALGLLGRHAESLTLLEAVWPQLVARKLPAWNLAQAKLGLAASLRALGKEPARVAQLLREVLALEGPRHAEQRARAQALLTER